MQNLNAPVQNERGQSLIEYLIIVALMGVATIGIVRTLQGALNSRYANVVHALQGSSKRESSVEVQDSDLKRKDLSDFMNGAARRKDRQ
ncbi:MAG: Flp family type IVb pilin [Bdellovibrionaceae bacterium]|nr:Flp family type IVb pilin [Bdellovibrionales bacterium]MCB9086543.1 Flp family type IVb pilin [Pseudobdellovibrionaceae bacterium]